MVSVHHYNRWKRGQGWIKEGKPGQAGIDYIYRLEQTELAALFPGARIAAAGFAGRIKSRVWPLFSGIAARLGLGHMLIATTRTNRPATG